MKPPIVADNRMVTDFGARLRVDSCMALLETCRQTPTRRHGHPRAPQPASQHLRGDPIVSRQIGQWQRLARLRHRREQLIEHRCLRKPGIRCREQGTVHAWPARPDLRKHLRT